MLKLRLILFSIQFYLLDFWPTETFDLKHANGKADAKPDCSVKKGPRCYEILQVPMTYEAADYYCRDRGGHLLAIKDGETASFLKSHLGQRYYWLGLKDSAHKGNYVFSDGTQLNNKDYSPWIRSSNQANNHEECVVLNSYSMGWFRDSCDQQQYAICQYEAIACNASDIRIDNAEYPSCNEKFNISIGSVMRVKCQGGYMLQGSENITCESSGKWSGVPKCISGCGLPSLPDQIVLDHKQEYYLIGDEVTVICVAGYFVNGHTLRTHTKITCEEGGVWSRIKFECSPIVNLRYTVDSYPRSVLNLGIGDLAILTCSIITRSEMASFIWFKDHEELRSGSNTGYNFQIKENGNLEIMNFQPSDAGVYVCLVSNNAMSKDITTYIVKSLTSCRINSTEESSTKFIEEESSLLLNCPIIAQGREVIWYKDGIPFLSTKRATILANNGIFIPKVLFSDSGFYKCKVIQSGEDCTEYSYSVKVIVMQLDTNACGTQEQNEVRPWLATIWWKFEMAPFCYGALVSEFWVITSAFCIQGAYRRRLPDIFVQFDKYTEHELSYSKAENLTTSIRIPVELLYTHPKFSRRQLLNDIGLIKLVNPIQLYGSLQPLCLFDFGIFPTYQMNCGNSRVISGFVAGWGSLEGNYQEQMKQASTEPMLINDGTECERLKAEKMGTSVIPELNDPSRYNVFCIMDMNRTRPKYSADVGAPFVVKRDNRLYLVGVYSWGDRMFQMGTYDYFTNISHYYSWITSYIPLKNQPRRQMFNRYHYRNWGRRMESI